MKTLRERILAEIEHAIAEMEGSNPRFENYETAAKGLVGLSVALDAVNRDRESQVGGL